MASPQITIRALRPEDRDIWAELWKAYLDFYETELPAEVYDTTFSRLTSEGANEFKGMIAEVDGTPAGLAHYLAHRSCWAVNDIVYLQDLYAASEVRGLGVGRALIEAVYKAADQMGAANVYWTTQDFNSNARQLYDRIGQLTPFVKYVRG